MGRAALECMLQDESIIVMGDTHTHRIFIQNVTGVVPGEEEQAEGKLDDSSEEEWDPPFSNLHFESE